MTRAKGGEKPNRTHPLIETIKARVEERVNAARLSKNEASRRAGLGLSYVNDILGDRSKDPTRESLAKLGAVIDTDVEYFFGEQPTPRRIASNDSVSGRAAPHSFSFFEVGLTDPDGFFALNPARMGTSLLPLANSVSAYCIAVPDDTMAPRYKAGEIVIVNPRKPVSAGFVVVRQTDDRVAIREVVSITTETITVRSLGDQAIVEMPRSAIKSLERIVGSYELN